jgi:hypothetical protein
LSGFKATIGARANHLFNEKENNDYWGTDEDTGETLKKVKAVVTEAIINYWWQHYECQQEFQRAVKDYLILGHGWVKTGYRFVEEENVDNIEYTADEIAEKDPTGEVESQLIIREDRPFLERIDPFDIFVDPSSTSLNVPV